MHVINIYTYGSLVYMVYSLIDEMKTILGIHAFTVKPYGKVKDSGKVKESKKLK